MSPAMEYSPPNLAVASSLAKLPPSPPAEENLPSEGKNKDTGLMLSDTESFTSSIPDLETDLDIEPEILCMIRQKFEHLVRLYNAGKALFPRPLLAELDAQINRGLDEVTIQDFDGAEQKYSLKVPEWCPDFG